MNQPPPNWKITKRSAWQQSATGLLVKRRKLPGSLPFNFRGLLTLVSISCTWLTMTSAVAGPIQDQWPPNAMRFATDSMTGEEAFTEPIEQIKVAVDGNGIIKKLQVKRGDRVTPNELLMELDMSVLTATRQIALSKSQNTARLKAAQVEYKIKNARHEKLVRLLKNGAGSPEEVDRALGDVAVAEQNIEAIREETNQFRLEVIQYDAQMEQRRVRSPIQGQVVEVRKKVGEFVSSADPHVFTIVRLDTLRAVFHVPTPQAAAIQQDDFVSVFLPETNQRTTAKVEFVAPITQADSGRVRVDVLIANSDNQYRSGVRCRLIRTPSQANLPRTTRQK